MKTALLFVTASLSLFGQQPFDFSSLDKLEAKSKNRTNITLDGQLLKLAAGFLNAVDSGGDKDAAQLKLLVDNLKGIYVRGFGFDKEGQYTEADLEPLRNTLRRAPWSRIVDVHEGAEVSEIWVAQNAAGDKFAGVAIINAEPRELTVVYVSGLIGADDIARLNGRFGINIDALEGVGRNTSRNNGKKREDKKETRKEDKKENKKQDQDNDR